MIAISDIDKRSDIERTFRDYIRFGGFPFIHRNQLDANAALDYLEDLYHSIVLKDIVHRYGLRDVALFEKIMRYLMENMGTTFSSINLIKYLKQDRRSISNETIYNYIAYSEDAMLMNRVGREDIKGKELLKFQEKLYLTDHGFREQMFGSNQSDINRVLKPRATSHKLLTVLLLLSALSFKLSAWDFQLYCFQLSTVLLSAFSFEL